MPASSAEVAARPRPTSTSHSRPRRRRTAGPAVPPGVVRIVLHGRLKKEFGGPFDWGCSTPAHAIYALMRMKPGFRESIEKGAFRVVRGALSTGQHIDETMLPICFGNVRELHIVPAAVGRAKGNGGNILKIVVGVALIAVAVSTGFGAIGLGAAGATTGTTAAGAGAGAIAAAGTAFSVTNTLFGISAGAIGLFGAAMVLGGVGAILSHVPKPPSQNASFLLSVPQNIASQGGPIPLNYGRKLRVGSVVVSTSYIAAAFSSAGIPATTAVNGGAIDLLGGA